MKGLAILLAIVLFSACADFKQQDMAVNSHFELATADGQTNSPWENGLIDHKIANVTPPYPVPIYFDSLTHLKYSDNPLYFAKNHFRLNNNVSEPMQTIQANINAIDGVFVGIVRPNSTSSILPEEELIIALAVVERVWSSSNCQTENVRFFNKNKTKYFFKCTNRDLGTWTRMSLTDPLIEKFNNNKRGYFIGKDNLGHHIFQYPYTSMYLYIGYHGTYGSTKEKPELVAVDKPYFSNVESNTIGSVFTKSSVSPRYLSTIGGSGPPTCINLPSGHWTIRPCPNNCPQ
ncbi:hypothetical protein [Lacihabitans sp. LS3-19]|uniref:hypothetical protein n=1 Tax=Lacihabitans sp. LS3-19 TaxID=2487335 RepID=UPI0020CD191E|nr:hypothetical protein [Lacihabitans sp. LS3-19]